MMNITLTSDRISPSSEVCCSCNVRLRRSSRPLSAWDQGWQLPQILLPLCKVGTSLSTGDRPCRYLHTARLETPTRKVICSYYTSCLIGWSARHQFWMLHGNVTRQFFLINQCWNLFQKLDIRYNTINITFIRWWHGRPVTPRIGLSTSASPRSSMSPLCDSLPCHP